MPPGASSVRVCLDGFPFTREEASEIEKEVGLPHFVISLETPYQDAMRRLCLDISGNRIAKEVCAATQARYKSFPSAFSSVEEHYTEKGLLYKFKASEKEGVMAVFNQIKGLFSFMEASEIMARTAAGREKLVCGP